MPLKYRPQVPGWIGNLNKGTQYITDTDDRYQSYYKKLKSDEVQQLLLMVLLA